MSRGTLHSLFSLSCAAVVFGCGTPRHGPLPDAGTPDAGVDEPAPVEEDPFAHLPAPADTVFSLGVTDNSAGAPQSAPYLNLVFRKGTPSAETVVARRVLSPPVLDGDSADWVELPASLVTLQNRGMPIGMSQADWDTEYAAFGFTPPRYDFDITNAVVKAAFDDERVYFLVEWSDATENRSRELLTFNGAGWSRSSENEDRLYFGFAVGDTFPGFAVLGCSAACHFKERLGETSQEARNYRMRMHTNAPGELGDTWSWRATTTNPMGYADDLYWDEVSRKSDSDTDFVTSNRRTLDGGASLPIYMSEDGVNANPDVLYAPDAGLRPRAVPFDDDDVEVGATLPGFVHQRASPLRDDVRAVGRWRNGKWTVELSRALVTDDPHDVQLPLKEAAP